MSGVSGGYKLFHMKYLIVLVLFISLFGCCPQLTTSVTTTIDTTTTVKSDTITILLMDTVTLAPVLIHDTINMSSFCDSLKAGLSPVIRLRVDKGSITIKSDSTGHSEIECLTDSLNAVIEQQQTTITTLNEQLISKTISKDTVIEQPLFKNTWFWLFVFMIIVVSYFAFRKR